MNQNKLIYLLSSHKSYLEEYITDGIKNSPLENRIDEFFNQLNFALDENNKIKDRRLLIRNILSSHITFLEQILKSEYELKELNGFKLICSEFL